jgi:2-polyprenyl-6-methoxyphenol hydroxylase-like FAD-dependent oxidoreductase
MEHMTDVLVIGAGPTGLTLACDLARRGVGVRIVDRADRHPAGSRGKGLSPRSLEVLDDLGVIDEILASGRTHVPHRKYRGAEVVAEVDPEAGKVPTDRIPYPVGLLIAQFTVEEILRKRLHDLGCTVETGTGITALADSVAETADGRRIEARHIVGCDGGRSTVRRALGLTMHGHTPQTQAMAVGDVRVDGLDRDAWHQWFTADGAIMLCPMPGTDLFQVQASHERDADGNDLEPTLERFRATFDRVAGVPGVRLRDLTWRSTYRVNVRMVDRLRVGPVFLAGDAAHVHPIAGGLGMNTGIQDAYNLGWKLGLRLAGRAGDALLDTYEEERLPIASWLLDITTQRLDAAMEAIKEVGGGVDAVAASELSQLTLAYPWSRLSAPGLPDPSVRPGDRAPDARLADGRRLFDVLRGPDFTLLDLTPAGTGTAVTGVRVHHEPDGDLAAAYGPDRLVLIRPDGHVALTTEDPTQVESYLKAL